MAVRVMAPLHFYVLYIGNGVSLHIEQWHLVQTLKTRKIYIMQKGIVVIMANHFFCQIPSLHLGLVGFNVIS
jgi:hypothetical protein